MSIHQKIAVEVVKMENFVRVLGSADWHVTEMNDHSCYTVNDAFLVDACPSVVMCLLAQKVDPVLPNTVLFTHMHADHYMGLAPLLLYWRVRKSSLAELTIAGPKETVRAGFERAMHYVFHDSEDISEEISGYPTILELGDGDSFEANGFRVDALSADHAVPGLCYKLTDSATGRSVGFSGDTKYKDAFRTFFSGADLLLYEVSFGAEPVGANNETCRHSSAHEAIRVGEEASIRNLLLTHTYEPKRSATLEMAREKLLIPVNWAIPGCTFPF